MQAARDRPKSYADLKRKSMEFQVGDKVLEKVREVAYKLELPEELSMVHNTFHVSNLKKCYVDEPLAFSLDGLHFHDKLKFVEEPIEITDREVKRLKRSRIPLVKVRWNSRRGLEFIWEREDQFRKTYPYLFTKTAPSSSSCCDLFRQQRLTPSDYRPAGGGKRRLKSRLKCRGYEKVDSRSATDSVTIKVSLIAHGRKETSG
ncbi:hypothetical protein Tco_1327903 [Tanacetum coccineum]